MAISQITDLKEEFEIMIFKGSSIDKETDKKFDVLNFEIYDTDTADQTVKFKISVEEVRHLKYNLEAFLEGQKLKNNHNNLPHETSF